MSEGLLPHEDRVRESIQQSVLSNNMKIWLYGASGIGKTVLMESLADDYVNSGFVRLSFFGDSVYSSDDYHVFKAGIAKMHSEFKQSRLAGLIKNGSATVGLHGKASPITASVTVRAGSMEYNIKNEFSDFNEDARDIIAKFMHLSEKYNLILVCDNLQYWDELSLKMLYEILNGGRERFSFLSSAVIMCAHTIGITYPCQKLIERITSVDCLKKIQIDTPTIEEYTDYLSMINHEISLESETVRAIYDITDGNMCSLKVILESISDENELNFCEKEKLQFMKEIITKRIEGIDEDSDAIRMGMEYGAMLGIMFSKHELEKVLDWDHIKTEHEIEASKKLSFILDDDQDDKVRFAHDIIHMVFAQENDSTPEAAAKIAKCLSEICPEQYRRRSKYESLALNSDKSDILSILDLVCDLRGAPFDKKEQELEEKEGRILNKISERNPIMLRAYKRLKAAYGYYHNEQYEKIDIHDFPMDAPLVLNAEWAILKSLVLTKSSDFAQRDLAIDFLSDYDSLEACGNEIDVFERVILRKIACFTHTGNPDLAKKAQGQLLMSVKDRERFSDEAKKKKYIVFRIANSMYEAQSASQRIKSSMEYFLGDYSSEKPSLPIDLKQGYLSMLNYGAILCNIGRFNESRKQLKEARKYSREFATCVFPRTYLLKNNLIVLDHLTNKKTAHECAKKLKKVIGKLTDSAEMVYYNSNYAIFLAMDDKLDKAISILSSDEVLKKVYDDKETSYQYRIFYNLGVMLYLNGDTEKALEYVKKACEVVSDRSDLDFPLHRRRTKKALNYMKGNSICSVSPTEWDYLFTGDNDEHQASPERYYFRGFAYMCGFSWEI